MFDPKKIDEDLRNALKAKDECRLIAIRTLKTALKNKQVELMRPPSEAEFYQVVNTMVKQRRESIEQFEKGGRHDLASAEKRELDFLQRYLPPALSEEELVRIINDAIAESGAAGPKDMGVVMKAIKDKVAGRADGKFVSSLVIKCLQPKST
jgi:uncharacterized protein YqeY